MYPFPDSISHIFFVMVAFIILRPRRYGYRVTRTMQSRLRLREDLAVSRVKRLTLLTAFIGFALSALVLDVIIRYPRMSAAESICVIFTIRMLGTAWAFVIVATFHPQSSAAGRARETTNEVTMIALRNMSGAEIPPSPRTISGRSGPRVGGHAAGVLPNVGVSSPRAAMGLQQHWVIGWPSPVQGIAGTRDCVTYATYATVNAKSRHDANVDMGFFVQ
jgi:hypothetical protein